MLIKFRILAGEAGHSKKSMWNGEIEENSRADGVL